VYQKVVIVGNLGTDPEKRFLPSGQAVTNFNVATNRRWTGSDGQSHEETTWFRVTVWGRLAETCEQYLGKGQKVLIEGRLRPDPETGGPQVYQTQDGNWRASYELTAFEVKFLSSPRDGGFGGGGTNDFATQAGGGSTAPTTEDEIPF
jgi:single-strand DNA-binding protein